MNIHAERAHDELEGADAARALTVALERVTTSPARRIRLKDVQFTKRAGRIQMRVTWLEGKVLNDVAIRLPRAMAQAIRLRLQRVLGE